MEDVDELFCLLLGIRDHTSHNKPLVTPIDNWITPRLLIKEPDSTETNIMPIAPQIIDVNLMIATAEPVSLSCCSSMKLVPGTRVVMVASVANPINGANNQAEVSPRLKVSTPHKIRSIKQKEIIRLADQY